MLWTGWAVCAALILGVYFAAGSRVTGTRKFLGILVDSRGRYSLTRLQLFLWTLVVLSILGGIVIARAFVGGSNLLDISIPGAVLGVLGITVGSATVATGIKESKNRTRAEFIAASSDHDRSVAQMVMVEEGPTADHVVDIAKLQNFLITIFLAGAYVALVINSYNGSDPTLNIGGPGDIRSLPDLNGTFLTLLAISHAGYLAAKVPNRGEDTGQDVPKLSLAGLAAKRTVDKESGTLQPSAKDARLHARGQLADAERARRLQSRKDAGNNTPAVLKRAKSRLAHRRTGSPTS